MNRSTNFNFFLPTNADPMLVSDFTSNFETIDAKLAVANNLNQTTEGKVLDARQGKVLGDSVGSIQSNINLTNYENLTLAVGVSGTVRIARNMKIRMITGSVQPSSTGTNISVATLESGDRPPVAIWFSCTGYLVGAQCEGSIGSNGEITINVPTGGANNSVKFSITYFVN